MSDKSKLDQARISKVTGPEAEDSPPVLGAPDRLSVHPEEPEEHKVLNIAGEIRVLTENEIAQARRHAEGRTHVYDPNVVIALCATTEALRAELATTRAQRDEWNSRFRKLMDACGWDISFNIDRSINAMVERLSAARPDGKENV
jgi:hypothetical protein